ncbi:MAG: hypothetical protein K2N72_04665 [Oscillospiraceae bacterium]|nr:hypothetical protein [Oscillospiraceae bacterium]
MDELDMMSLELPSTEGLDDLEHPEKSGGDAEGGSVTENAVSESGSGEHDYHDEDYSYEYEGGELEDMAVPTLSEMDGSELGTFAANAAAEKTVSLDKPGAGGNGSTGLGGLSEMSGAPAFSEMSGTPAGGQTGQYGGQGMNGQYGSNASGNNFGNNANNSSYNSPNNMHNMQNQQGGYGRQNTYAPVNPGSASGGMSQNSGRTDYWDMMDQDLPLVQRGAKIAKVISTIIIIISVLDIIGGLLSFAFRTVIAAGYRIYFSVRLKNGSHNSRYWLGLGCVLSVIFNVISMFEISGWSGEVVEIIGSAWIITVIEAIILVPTVGFGIMAYFLLLDKSVEAFCERNVGRGDF